MHRGWGKCKLPSGKANKDSKSKPILTQNANFTLLFAIQHEIPIPPKSPLSRWEMLSPSDFLGQNWLLKARTDAVFFEKSCPKVQFLTQKQILSSVQLYAHITHFFGLRRIRLNGIITSPCPEVTLDTFGFPVGARSAARRAVFWHQLPKMALFGVNNALFWSEMYHMLSYSIAWYCLAYCII